jgi:hypothetical protein
METIVLNAFSEKDIYNNSVLLITKIPTFIEQGLKTGKVSQNE